MSFAPSPEAEQITRDLANDLMSPYCPGRTISSCPSQQARKLEDYILEQAEAGQSKEQIEQSLVVQFGEEKLGSKDDPMVVYGSVGVAIVGAILILTMARRWLRPAPSAAPAGGVPSEAAGGSRAELDALEDALDDLEEF